MTFGGKGYAELYMTSAGGDQRNGEGESAGALFRIESGTTGRPEFFSRIGL